MVKYSVWSVLFWASIIVLVIWAIGKSLGLIQSPQWVEMIPFYSAAGALIYIGKQLERLNNISKEIVEVKQDVREIQKKAGCLRDARCSSKRNR